MENTVNIEIAEKAVALAVADLQTRAIRKLKEAKEAENIAEYEAEEADAAAKEATALAEALAEKVVAARLVVYSAEGNACKVQRVIEALEALKDLQRRDKS